jgi:hypothetical protein
MNTSIRVAINLADLNQVPYEYKSGHYSYNLLSSPVETVAKSVISISVLLKLTSDLCVI